MKRLTKWNDGELLVREEEWLLNANGVITKDEMYKIMRHLAERLAKYEDTELTPELIETMKGHNHVLIEQLGEYQQLEEQGLLHKTPVAIGQTVYTNLAMSGWYLRSKDRPYKAKVVFIGLNDAEEDGGGFFNVEYEKRGCMMQFKFSDIGKSVFLTKEEAEHALC